MMNYAKNSSSIASKIRKRLLERSAINRKRPDRYHCGSIPGLHGGHRGIYRNPQALTDGAGETGTLALVPAVVDAVSVPVIAAGGIADARGIAAAFMLGAEGVQMGTAFLQCPESAVPVAPGVARLRTFLSIRELRRTEVTDPFRNRELVQRPADYKSLLARSRNNKRLIYKQLFLTTTSRFLRFLHTYCAKCVSSNGI